MTDFADPKSLTADERESGGVFAPKFNADGLVIAITVDADTLQVLMTAFMNAEAIHETLRTGHAHYYSRSRQKLWKKGETSGEIQEVAELRTDCDQDAILMLVNQTGHGAACHTGRKTCFYRKLETDGDGVRLVDAGEPQLFNPEKIYSP